MRSTTKLLTVFATLALHVPAEAQHFRVPSFQPPRVPIPAAPRRVNDTLNPYAFSASAAPSPALAGLFPGVQVAGGGPNLAGQGFYQGPSAWNGGYRYNAPPSPSGNQFTNGFLGRAPGGWNGGYQFGQYGNGQLSTVGVQGGYMNPNAWNVGMSTYNGGPNGGQGVIGGLSRGPAGYTSNFGVSQVDPQGQITTRSGTMTYRDANNWGLGTNYAGPDGRSYGVNTRQNNGITTLGAQGRPGAIPGTRVNGRGDVTFRGSNTVLQGGGTVSDSSGLVRLGGGDGWADRHGITGNSEAGIGNIRGTQTDDIRFRGVDSTYTRNAQGSIPGVGTAHQNVGVSRRGVSFDTGVKVGGATVGFSGNISPPITPYSAYRPHVSAPHVSAPNVSLPEVSTPSVSPPHWSAPSVSIPSGNILSRW